MSFFALQSALCFDNSGRVCAVCNNRFGIIGDFYVGNDITETLRKAYNERNKQQRAITVDIENSMVVGAQDVYDGCGRAYDRSSSLDEAREYFYTDEGMLELHEHLLDVGYGMILRHLVLASHSATSAGYCPTQSAKAINVVERAIEFLANKKVNGVHQ